MDEHDRTLRAIAFFGIPPTPEAGIGTLCYSPEERFPDVVICVRTDDTWDGRLTSSVAVTTDSLGRWYAAAEAWRQWERQQEVVAFMNATA